MAKQRRWRFKLRTILLAVSLTVLVIPAGGIYIFRIYEGELVKQSELELIAQGALIAALYKSEVATLVKLDGMVGAYGRKVNPPAAADEYFRPVKPQLNLSRYRIRSRPADAAASELQADRFAREVGGEADTKLLDAQRTNWRECGCSMLKASLRAAAKISANRWRMSAKFAKRCRALRERHPRADHSPPATGVGVV